MAEESKLTKRIDELTQTLIIDDDTYFVISYQGETRKVSLKILDEFISDKILTGSVFDVDTQILTLTFSDTSTLTADFSSLAKKTDIPKIDEEITENGTNAVQGKAIYVELGKMGYNIECSMNSDTNTLTINLLDKSGNTIGTDDVVIETTSVIVDATYDSSSKSIILTLQGGKTLTINVSDIVSGLVTEATFEARKSNSVHFHFKDKEPYWNTTDQTITIYENCPLIVNNTSYHAGSDMTIQLSKIDNSAYICVFLDTTKSSQGTLVFTMQRGATMTSKSTEGLSLFGVFNIDKHVCSTSFNMNIDGVLNYAKGSDLKKTTDLINSVMIDEKVSIFDTLDTIAGEYYNISGQLTKESTVSRTPLIDVKKIYTIHPYISQALGHIVCFFDNSKTFLSAIRLSTIGEHEVAIPKDAAYVSCAFYTVDTSKFYLKAIYEKNPEYKGKKMNCLGDSITYGYIPDNGSQMSNPYPSILKEKLQLAECRNYGITGSKLATKDGSTGRDPMSIRYTNMSDDADIVSVFGGTNDYGESQYTPNLGSINDTETTSVYGALNVLCNGLITKYPKAFIFFMTPIRRGDKTGNNSAGYSLEDVSNAIKEVCYKYSIPVLDLYSKGGFYIDNSAFQSVYGGVNDKVHPNQSFVKERLEPMIEKFIRSNY